MNTFLWKNHICCIYSGKAHPLWHKRTAEEMKAWFTWVRTGKFRAKEPEFLKKQMLKSGGKIAAWEEGKANVTWMLHQLQHHLAFLPHLPAVPLAWIIEPVSRNSPLWKQTCFRRGIKNVCVSYGQLALGAPAIDWEMNVSLGVCQLSSLHWAMFLISGNGLANSYKCVTNFFFF